MGVKRIPTWDTWTCSKAIISPNGKVIGFNIKDTDPAKLAARIVEEEARLLEKFLEAQNGPARRTPDPDLVRRSLDPAASGTSSKPS